MTEANSRMARLETDPVLREEAETIRIMTAMYCRDRHGTSGRPDGLCPEMQRLPRVCAQAPCVLSVRCVEARLRQVPHPLLSRKGEGAGA